MANVRLGSKWGEITGSMTSNGKPMEALVGFFVLLGLGVIGFHLFHFGKFEGRFDQNYQIVLEMQDASGIREGIPVRLAGVPVGFVAGDPEVKPDFSGLRLPLTIYDQVRIPAGARFTVGTSGLMGDRFIRIAIPAELGEGFIEPGSVHRAVPGGALESVQTDAENLLMNLDRTLLEFGESMRSMERVLGRVEDILAEENVATAERALDDLAKFSSQLRLASERLDPLMTSAEDTMGRVGDSAERLGRASARLDPLLDTAEESLAGVKTAAEGATGLIDDAEVTLRTGTEAMEKLSRSIDRIEPDFAEVVETLGQFRGTLDQLASLAATAQTQDGFLRALMEDPQLARDLKSLIGKLEEHGVLFYPRERDSLPRVVDPGRGRR